MLIFAFLLGAAALLLQGLLVPRLALLAFAPYLALVILRTKLPKALWLSAAAGILLDLLSDDPMGVNALNYVITSALLYRFRMHFLFDQPLHLSLFSALVSSLSTALQLIILFLFDRKVPFGGKWILGDLLAMPVIDALYSFVWFTAPLVLFEKARRMWLIFWLKRQVNSKAGQ